MEAKGIPTDKGDLNRWIKKANNILRDIRKKIAGLTDWIKAIKEELSKPQAPTLAALLTDYYEAGTPEHGAATPGLEILKVLPRPSIF